MVTIDKRYQIWTALLMIVAAAFHIWINPSSDQSKGVTSTQPIETEPAGRQFSAQISPEHDERLPFLQTSFLTASLAALEKNGSNLALPMRSRHQVRCESREIAQQVQLWGRDSGFEATEANIFLGHGGVEFFDVELVRAEVPQVARIQDQGRLIRQGLSEFNGAEYATWVGEIVTKSKS